jgi:hypothetical protein
MSMTNASLAMHLELAGWSPRKLGREINRLFGPGTVSETAPYYWRDRGGMPHAPLPALAAFALSRQLGRPVSVEALWEGGATESAMVMTSDSGFDLPWNFAATLQVADDWLMASMLDRRIFLTVSGATLARAVAAYLAGASPIGEFAVASAPGDGPLVEQIEQSIPLLQRLDDANGGAANLSYVAAQVRAVSMVLRESRHDPGTTRRLLVALADLSQLAGWMALDAGKHGLGQRHLFTALRAAHDAGYETMAGHALADLSVQATCLDDPDDAVMLGEAAARASRKAPNSVRASIHSRLAHAYAGAGDLQRFDRARTQALELLASRDRDQDPGWMYYLTENHLDCQAGYSMIMMGRRRSTNRRDGDRLIDRGQELLERGAHRRPLNDPSQRRALYEGAWLALGYATRGQLDMACQIGRTAVERLDQVRSPRSMTVLRALDHELRPRARNSDVREFLRVLQAAVASA